MSLWGKVIYLPPHFQSVKKLRIGLHSLNKTYYELEIGQSHSVVDDDVFNVTAQIVSEEA
jgi:hypothetical protein